MESVVQMFVIGMGIIVVMKPRNATVIVIIIIINNVVVVFPSFYTSLLVQFSPLKL
jgi:hypothetical protein